MGGDARKLDMMDDGLDAKVELEKQIHAGKPVASAITEIAPFRAVAVDRHQVPSQSMEHSFRE